MTIELETVDERDYVEVRWRGVYTEAALLDAIDRTLDIAESRGAATLVMNIDEVRVEERPLDTKQRYALGEKAARVQLGHVKRIFLAVVGKQPMIDPERFAETVALNRGAYGKVFDDMDEALGWIKQRLSN